MKDELQKKLPGFRTFVLLLLTSKSTSVVLLCVLRSRSGVMASMEVAIAIAMMPAVRRLGREYEFNGVTIILAIIDHK